MTNQSKNISAIVFRVPEERKKALIRDAESDGRTLTSLLNRIVQAYLNARQDARTNAPAFPLPKTKTEAVLSPS